MLRISKLEFSLSRELAALLAAITIFLLPNILFAFTRFKYSQYFFLEIALHFFLIFSLFFCCSFNKKIFCAFAFSAAFLTTISAFFYNNFGILIDSSTLANAYQNRFDAGSLINIYSATIYTICFLILPFFLINCIKISNEKSKKTIIVLATIFVTFALILSQMNHTTRKEIIVGSYSPISLINSFYSYAKQRIVAKKNIKNLKPINKIIPDLSFDDHKIKNLKVVLIIGESAREKNFSINGYKRETNPLLSKEKNLLSFKDVSPCHGFTSQAVSCLMSFDAAKTKSENEKSKLIFVREESLIKAFEKIGFSTAWFSMQKAIGSDNVLITIASQAQKYFFKNDFVKEQENDKYDEALVKSLELEIKKSGNDFVVLQGNGSHFLFDDRYPESFKKFTPTCSNKNPKTCPREALINSYDNSILYTDHFISKVIEKLKNENAILLYVSDHGQFLGESDIFYHGDAKHHNKPEHKIPMFLWMSDSLLKNRFYSQNFANAKQKIGDKLSHDNIFDSALQCSGARSESFDRNLSLCKNN